MNTPKQSKIEKNQRNNEIIKDNNPLKKTEAVKGKKTSDKKDFANNKIVSIFDLGYVI